jgi:hypothetical protein
MLFADPSASGMPTEIKVVESIRDRAMLLTPATVRAAAHGTVTVHVQQSYGGCICS